MQSWTEQALARGWILAGLFGALMYLAIAGWGPLDPTNLAWLYRQGDIAGAYNGWALYRDTPWQSQIALNPAYGIDFSGSILYADAIPLMAIPFKALSPILPETFQYFGIWTFMSFVLQGVFGWFVMGKASADPRVRLLGALLISLAPIYIYRLVSCTHMSLTAHWLVLAALNLCLPPHTRRQGLWWGLVIGAAGFVHAYLFCIVAALWAADLLRRVFRDVRGTVIELVAVSAVLATVVNITGVWSGPSGEQQGGFGWFKMNVLSFIDPEPWTTHGLGARPPWSYLMPDIPNWGGDYEGFAYLGLGGLLLMAAAAWALVRGWKHLPWREALPYWPLAGALVGMGVFALSRNVTFGNVNFYIWWPAPIEYLGELFRATGRFIWPLYYAAFVGAVYLVSRHFPTRLLFPMLAAVVLVQGIDTQPGWKQESTYLHERGPGHQTAYVSPFWSEAAEHYVNVRMAPHSNAGEGYLDIAGMARREGLHTDAVYLARVRTTATEASAARIERGVATGEWPQDTMFVLLDAALIDRIRATNDAARNGLFLVDGVTVLAPGWTGCANCGAEEVR